MTGAQKLIRGHSGSVAPHELAGSGLLEILSFDDMPSSLLSAALMLGDPWDDMAR